MPPAQGIAGGLRRRVRQDGQDEAFGVPERMPVVAGPGQSLRGDGPLLGAGACLKRVEQREPQRLLELGVAFDLDVGAIPEVVEIRALSCDEPVPAGVPRFASAATTSSRSAGCERRLDHA